VVKLGIEVYIVGLERGKKMRKLGIPVILILLLTVFFGATSAQAVDGRLLVVNQSQTTVKVSVVWSGGGFDPFKLGPGETRNVTVPAHLDSVKMEVTGKCRDGVETFNPQRVLVAAIDCKDNLYTIALGAPLEKPKP
jgi:hypothetical protein